MIVKKLKNDFQGFIIFFSPFTHDFKILIPNRHQFPSKSFGKWPALISMLRIHSQPQSFRIKVWLLLLLLLYLSNFDPFYNLIILKFLRQQKPLQETSISAKFLKLVHQKIQHNSSLQYSILSYITKVQYFFIGKLAKNFVTQQAPLNVFNKDS